jgi:DNA-3-methyladenine glycosylase II
MLIDMPKLLLSSTEYLRQKDKKLGKIISYFGVSVAKIQKREPFDALVRGIISQQLSNSVSRSIEAKIIEIHGKRPFRPDVTLTIENQQLRECGISNSKIKAIKGIANACLRNELTIESFAGLTDEDALKKLTSYWGIGPWTADIFMMFCLKRLNVLALGDAGLQRAHQLIYPRAKSLEITSQKWEPYRALAACYLWKFLDNPECHKTIFKKL